MVTTKSVPSYRVTSADWIPMYANEERLYVPALNNGGSNFDDTEDYNIDVESPSMDPAIRFQSLDISLDHEYMMPGSVRGGNVIDTTIEERFVNRSSFLVKIQLHLLEVHSPLWKC